jgi:multidrug efflux pump subunit AcrB
MGDFFVRRPIVAIVLSIFIVLLGYLAIQQVPVAQYPDITPPTININANFQGANALNVEQAVTTVIEQKVNGIEDMLYLRSTNSSDGNMALTVTFDVGTNLDNANMLTQINIQHTLCLRTEQAATAADTAEKKTSGPNASRKNTEKPKASSPKPARNSFKKKRTSKH